MRISGIWNDPIGFVFHITCKNKLRAMMEQDPDGTGKTLEFLDDFEFDEGQIRIQDKARKLLITKIMDKLNSKINFNDKKMSYEDIILYQGRLLGKYLTGEEKNYVGFSRRW